MNDDCRMISDPAEFRAIFEGIRSATDITARMPAQVFGAGFGHYQFLEFDCFCTPQFWSMLQILIARSGDDRVHLIVLDPEPEAYFYKHFKRFGALSLPAQLSSQEYLDILGTGPKSSPADAVGINSFVLALVPPSLRWLIWGERDSETMVLGYRYDFDRLSVEDIAQSGMVALTPERALDFSSSAWRDGNARAIFAQEILKNYSSGALWIDPSIARAVGLAEQFIAGEISTIEACRALSLERNAIDRDLGSAFRRFDFVVEETNHLPVGHVRREWSPQALALEDVEIARCEAEWRPLVLDSCKELIEHFQVEKSR